MEHQRPGGDTRQIFECVVAATRLEMTGAGDRVTSHHKQLAGLFGLKATRKVSSGPMRSRSPGRSVASAAAASRFGQCMSPAELTASTSLPTRSG